MDQAGKPRRIQGRTLLKGLAAVVALACFLHYAYVRVSTPPPDARARLAQLAERLRPPLADDGTSAIAQAIADLPTLPTFSEPAPPGLRWVFQRGTAPRLDLTLVNAGPWKPADRPLLRTAIGYLSDPATTAVLEQLKALRGQNWRFSWQYETGVLGTIGADGVPYAGFRSLAKLLAARARYRHAELHDIEGAWDDLRTALLLCDTASCGLTIDYLVVAPCEAVALSELHSFVMGAELTESLAGEISNTLHRLRPPDELFEQSLRHEAERTRWVIDAIFTDDGRGGGWLLLSEWEPISRLLFPPGAKGADVSRRSRLWNAASFFFNDRRTVEGKWQRFGRVLEDARRLPYPQARAALEALATARPFNLVDGPQLSFLSLGQNFGYYAGLHKQFVRASGARRAARIMVALNRYRSAHGRYPDSLAMLAPRYIEELESDPYCGGPFGYRVEPGGGYTLYSCGEDAYDDGGLAHEARPNAGTSRGGGSPDDVYSVPRPEHDPEPVLEPIPTDPAVGGPGSGEAP